MAIARKTPAPAATKPAETKSAASASAKSLAKQQGGKSADVKTAAVERPQATKPAASKKAQPKAVAPKAEAPKPLVAKAPAAKAAPDLLDKIQIPSFSEAPEALAGAADDIKEQVRLVAEQNAEQTRQLYERLKEATEQAKGSFETSYSAASRGLGEFQLKAMEALKANAEANLEFVRAMWGIRSLSEAVALQGQHARVQFETLSAQAKDLSSLAQRVAAETVEPIKTGLTKGLQSSS
ncbi:MAG: phasin [Hyphomicrobiales bacterium]|nr:phasin [Hyphomicrobiales bacterium]